METKTLLTIFAVGIFALTAHAQIPNWTREQLIQMYERPGVSVKYDANHHISNITFTKQEPHSFHGGECLVLILMTLRGPDKYHWPEQGGDIEDLDVTNGPENSVTWIDHITGSRISSGEGVDFFQFTARRNGRVILTAKLVGIPHGSAFVLKAR